MITIIDYGMGNLASVSNAFAKLGYATVISSDPEQVAAADQVILPGVGAFADAMTNLKHWGLDEAIREICNKEVPLLGICLGLQLLFSESYENGVHKGLDIISGTVEKLRIPLQYKVPHMGWNNLTINPASLIFKGLKTGDYFYFVHSYYVVPADAKVTAACSNYGLDFTCAVEKGNIFAVQFHPEKSGRKGLQILKNFGEMH